jgi:hypothetical protein
LAAFEERVKRLMHRPRTEEGNDSVEESEQSGKKRRMGSKANDGSFKSEPLEMQMHKIKIPALTGLVHDLTISDPLDEMPFSKSVVGEAEARFSMEGRRREESDLT